MMFNAICENFMKAHARTRTMDTWASNNMDQVKLSDIIERKLASSWAAKP